MFNLFNGLKFKCKISIMENEKCRSVELSNLINCYILLISTIYPWKRNDENDTNILMDFCCILFYKKKKKTIGKNLI